MTTRSLAIGVGALLTAGMIGWGGISAVSLTSGTEREVLHKDWAAGDSLIVDTTSGDITFSRSSNNRIYLTAEKEGVLAMPDVDFERTGSSVSIETNCPVLGWWAECRASFDLAVPDGVAITATTRSGDLDVHGVDSPTLDVESASGDVNVTELEVDRRLSAQATSGDVNLDRVTADTMDLGTTSGDVQATELTTTESATLDATSGDVTGDFEQVPPTITADATSGDVTVLVPDGPYQVHADVTSGDEDTQVRPGGNRRIDATATSGDVTVKYR